MAKSRQQLRQEMRKGNGKNTNNNSWLWILITVILVLAIAIGAYFATRNSETDNQAIQNQSDILFDKEPNVNGEHDRVKFVMENGGEFIVELYPEYAPETVENFINLVSSGFYDGLTFHRVVDGFMAQGGSPNGDGTGGSDKAIKGEFASNGFTKNTLSHQRGVISMARTDDPNSASSGFFICYDDASFLDGNYAAFGKVIEGMETVDKFLDVERELNSLNEVATPKTPIVIKSVSIIK